MIRSVYNFPLGWQLKVYYLRSCEGQYKSVCYRMMGVVMTSGREQNTQISHLLFILFFSQWTGEIKYNQTYLLSSARSLSQWSDQQSSALVTNFEHQTNKLSVAASQYLVHIIYCQWGRYRNIRRSRQI